MACCPYGKRPLLITAQVLSVVAWFLSFGSILSIILGLAAWILLLCAACCKLNRCGFITAGVFACIAGIGNLIVLIAAGALAVNPDDVVIIRVISAIGMALWISVAVMTFMVTNKLEEYERDNDTVNRQSTAPQVTLSQNPKATAVPMGSAAVPMGQSTTTQSVTVQPDGSKRTETTVTNPDGSKTTTVTVEEATEHATEATDEEMDVPVFDLSEPKTTAEYDL